MNQREQHRSPTEHRLTPPVAPSFMTLALAWPLSAAHDPNRTRRAAASQQHTLETWDESQGVALEPPSPLAAAKPSAVRRRLRSRAPMPPLQSSQPPLLPDVHAAADARATPRTEARARAAFSPAEIVRVAPPARVSARRARLGASMFAGIPTGPLSCEPRTGGPSSTPCGEAVQRVGPPEPISRRIAPTRSEVEPLVLGHTPTPQM